MDRKPKYTLFPAKPSPPPLEPLPPLPEGRIPSESREPSPLLPLQGTSTPSPPQDPTSTIPQEPAPPTPQEPLIPPPETSPSSRFPPLNNSWSSPTSPSPPTKMHTPSSSTSTSSTTSFQKPPPILQPPPTPPTNPRSRPRTVYFHSGIGGAGNYHKAIREDNVLRSMIPNRNNQTKFFSSLFGKRGRRQRECGGSDGTGSSGSSSQTLELGAAEVMRRKMLGIAREDGKGRERS